MAPKFSPHVTQPLLETLRVDGDFVRACRSAGIAPATGYDWLNLGRDSGNTLYAAFRKAVVSIQADVKQARAAGHLEQLAAVTGSHVGVSAEVLA